MNGMHSGVKIGWSDSVTLPTEKIIIPLYVQNKNSFFSLFCYEIHEFQSCKRWLQLVCSKCVILSLITKTTERKDQGRKEGRKERRKITQEERKEGKTEEDFHPSVKFTISIIVCWLFIFVAQRYVPLRLSPFGSKEKCLSRCVIQQSEFFADLVEGWDYPLGPLK